MQSAKKSQTPHLFSVAEYMKLDIQSRTELLGGVIYDVSPKNAPHGFAIRRLIRALSRGLGGEYSVSVQDPIALEGWTGKYAPEIDVAVIAEKPYRTTPTSADSFAFVEVSDTTYDEDRKVKMPLYVAARVPTWHVNILSRRVEFYDIGADVNAPRIFTENETMEIRGVKIPVADLFDAI